MTARDYRDLLKELLAGQTRNLRQSMKISQDEMAELLRVSSRAYGDLERGKYCFSTTTPMFFLLLMKESELEQLLKIFKERACA